MDEFEDYFERDDRKAEVKVRMSSEYLNGTDVCVPSVIMCRLHRRTFLFCEDHRQKSASSHEHGSSRCCTQLRKDSC